MKPAQRRQWGNLFIETFDVSDSNACEVTGFSRGAYYSERKRSDDRRYQGIQIEFIHPGCPYQNSFIERFKRTYREDVLDLYLFETLDEFLRITDDLIRL